MRTSDWKMLLGGIMLLSALLACGLPSAAGNPAGTVTSLSGTLSAVQTGTAAALTATAGAPTPAPPPTATSTNTPLATATPGPTTVTQLALCWTGPGTAYPVVSSVKVGTAVELIGVGSVPGWYVITNPKYGDRCWIESKNLKIDPKFNLARLKLYNPPPTPGPTPTEGPTPTP